MLDPRDEQQLVGVGDTLLHYHLSDRIPTVDTLEQLWALAPIFAMTSSGEVPPHAAFILADSTAGSVTVQLPPAFASREIEIIKLSTANRVLILPTPPEKILGQDGVILQTQYDALRLKALEGFGWVAL